MGNTRLSQKICFIGAGSMAEAIVKGILRHELVLPKQIFMVNNQNLERLQQLKEKYEVSTSNEHKHEYIQSANIIILAMKPDQTIPALKEIRQYTNSDQIIISVIAGISSDVISSNLNHSAPVIRAMPNTSAIVGYSGTGIYAGKTANTSHLQIAVSIFNSIGIVIPVHVEDELHSITGISGSGPAYVYYLVENMIKGAQDVGIDKETAKKITLQTLHGAVKMLDYTQEDPSILRANITSPNGTTQAGVDVLKSYHVDKAVRQCIQKATIKSREIGKMFEPF